MSYSQLNLNAKKIIDFQGKLKTLSHGEYSFVQLKNSYFLPKNTNVNNILFLGLGYNASNDCLPLIENAEQVYFHEFSGFTEACHKENIICDLPKSFISLSKKEIFELLSKDKSNLSQWKILIYRQNLSIFPNYWNKLLAELEDFFYQSQANIKQENKVFGKSIFIAGSHKDLMFQELIEAGLELDFEVLTSQDFAVANITDLQDYYSGLSALMRQKKPDFFLSVNGRNLDSYGQIYALLNQLKIPVILWIVDNPWNILSAFKNNWWQNCQIYLTDQSFIPILKSQGAKYVDVLPLASASHSAKLNKINTHEILYVGHSAFKDKSKFFAAQSINEDFVNIAKKSILENFQTSGKSNKIINYHNIFNELYHNKKENFWLENDFRQISLLAYELDIFHKAIWLNQLCPKLTLIGDQGWKKVLKNITEIIAPVDYYNVLPSYYANAKFTLNITSMLMPSALTQRHFDVWKNKGFLLTTSSDGLTIFNSNLIDEIIVTNTNNLEIIIDKLQSNSAYYNEIKTEFQQAINKEHLYRYRLKIILENIKSNY